MNTIFEVIEDYSLVSEETFLAWEKSKDTVKASSQIGPAFANSVFYISQKSLTFGTINTVFQHNLAMVKRLRLTAVADEAKLTGELTL